MTNEDKKPTDPPAVAQVIGPSILGSLPPSDPADLKAFKDNWLNNKHFSAIGQVAAIWAYFEAVIDTWLMAFAGIESEIGVCFTSHMLGSRPKMDSFIAMVRYLGAHQKWHKILDAFAKDVQALSEQRNRAVHDVWDFTASHDPHRIEATARRVVRIVEVPVSTEKLLRLAWNIDALRQKFDDLASELFTEIHTSSGKSPPKSGG